MGSGPSGNTMQTSNSTSTSTAPPFVADKLKSLIGGGAWPWMEQNMTAPGYFPGGTVAPQSERGISADTSLWQRGANGLGFGLDSGSRQLTADTIAGKYLDPASNPAYRGWLEASFRPQAEQFRDILAPSIDSTFAGSGRTGGGAHFDTMMRGVSDLTRNQSDAAAKAGLGMYMGERDKQFSALDMLPSFQAMDYQNISALGQAGGAADTRAQSLLDDQNAKYGYDSTAQLDWYNRLAQSLQSMFPGGQTSGTGQSFGQGGGGGGGAGQFIGPALQVAGMALPFLSDARAKDVHARVGFTDDGLPLYLYQYKGSDVPQIGPMAQEVEQTMPDAVAEHPSGYKVVDYARLAPGGLL